MIFKRTLVSFFYLILSSVLYAEADDNEYYFDLLRKVSNGEKEVLLQEYKLRKINPTAYLSELYRVEEGNIKALLLQEVQSNFILKEKWLGEKEISSLNVLERIVVWERAKEDLDFCEKLKVLELSSNFFPNAETIEKKCIYFLHGKYQSRLLLKQNIFEDVRDARLRYNLVVSEKLKKEDLIYNRVDSLRLSKLKLDKALNRTDYIAIAQSYDKAPDRVAVLALKNRNDEFLLGILKSKSTLKKAEAVYELCKGGLKKDILENSIINGSWNERNACMKILLKYKEAIELDWLKGIWEKGNLASNGFLCRFLADSSYNPLFDVLKSGLENKKNRPILKILRSMEYFKIKMHSKWLLDLTLNENFQEDIYVQSLRVLYLWDEAGGEKRYVKIYKDRKYKTGGIGGEYLFPLIGKSKDPAAKGVIAGHLNASLTNPFLNAAIEGAGWYRDKSLGARIKKLIPVDGRGPMVNWAIDRCDGKEVAFPKKTIAKVRKRNNFSYLRE